MNTQPRCFQAYAKGDLDFCRLTDNVCELVGGNKCKEYAPEIAPLKTTEAVKVKVAELLGRTITQHEGETQKEALQRAGVIK